MDDPFALELETGMAAMMEAMHGFDPSGDADVDFLAMMIPHHQGAIAMARALLVHGYDPATRRLAEEIIASQSVEIAAMKQRLEILKTGDMEEDGAFPALGGTRGPPDRPAPVR